MSENGVAPFGFAYLFEKFPSFSQTFCAREVEAMGSLGLDFPIFSIRHPTGEPPQDLHTPEVVYLPEKFDEILATDTGFRRAARRGLDDLRKLWGGEGEKKRIYEALWLGPICQQARIRHVHVHFAGTAARMAFWLKKLFGVHYSVTAHANDIFRDEPPERLAQIFQEAAVVVTVSDFSLRFLQENYPALRDRFCRVYNGIRTQSFIPTSRPAGRPLIVSIGRYIEKKGFADLIAACAALKDLDFECQIIGHGPLEDDLKRQVAEAGLAEKVLITGPKPESEIKSLLGRAHLFALACVTAEDGAMDNLPTVIMEAMAAGLPVVSTALAGVPEMVIAGETGFIVPERNPAAFGEKMGRLLGDAALAEQMGKRGLARCLDVFDLAQTSSALRKVFVQHGALPE